MNVLLGIAGLVATAAAVVVAWRARRKAVRWGALVVELAGWQVCWRFLIQPYVPMLVAAGALLGGIALTILAVAALNWWSPRKRTNSTSEDDLRRP